jgi:hypothetical protein
VELDCLMSCIGIRGRILNAEEMQQIAQFAHIFLVIHRTFGRNLIKISDLAEIVLIRIHI